MKHDETYRSSSNVPFRVLSFLKLAWTSLLSTCRCSFSVNQELYSIRYLIMVKFENKYLTVTTLKSIYSELHLGWCWSGDSHSGRQVPKQVIQSEDHRRSSDEFGCQREPASSDSGGWRSLKDALLSDGPNWATNCAVWASKVTRAVFQICKQWRVKCPSVKRVNVATEGLFTPK